MDQLSSIFSSQPSDKDDLLSKYQTGGSSEGSHGSIFGGTGNSNKSVFDNISSYGKTPSNTENAFMSSASAFSSAGHGMNLGDTGMNGAYEEKGSITNILNVKAANQTQLSLTNSLRGIQAKRLDVENGEVSIAEMYNDSTLDTRAGGGRYNVTITDIYKDKKLFMGFHGLHTDGKIDDNDVDITNQDNRPIDNKSIYSESSGKVKESTQSNSDPFKKIEIVNAWDKKSEWDKTSAIDINSGVSSEVTGVSLMSIPAGIGFMANKDSKPDGITLIQTGDGFKGDLKKFTSTGISDIMNDNEVRIDRKNSNTETDSRAISDITNEWNKKSLWMENEKIAESKESGHSQNKSIIIGSSGYKIKDDNRNSVSIQEDLDELKKVEYLEDEVLKLTRQEPNVVDYNSYIENIGDDFILNIFEFRNVKLRTLTLSELIDLKNRVSEEQKITMNTDHYIIIYDQITKAIIRKSF